MTSIPRADPYYDGHSLPFSALSPEEFERFVFSCLLCIQDTLGLQITAQPSGTGDGGFDVEAKVSVSGRLCCIQCKRYENPLDTATVVKELAKVAAVSALTSSDVGEHRFICSGKVRNKLRQLLRENGLARLATETGDCLSDASDGELATLRAQLTANRIDLRSTAENYVRRLDALVVWDMDEFDSALSARWNDVLQVVERFFRVATVVREHPRAYFDRPFYLRQHASFCPIVEPRAFPSELPNGISTDTNSLVDHSPANEQLQHLRQLNELGAGEVVVLIGEGGVGKSTALQFIAANTLRSSAGSILPIIISLSNYVAGALDRLIHQELGVNYGNWRALPDHLLLLCDGLNECPSEHISAFLEELKPILTRARVACVLSTRDTIRQRKIILPVSQVTCLRIAPLTPNGLRRLASHELPESDVAAFLSAFRALADASNLSHLWTPFAAKVAIRLWGQQAVLPLTLGKMIGTVLRQRTERNLELDPVYVDGDVVLQLAAALAFDLLIIDRRLECEPLNAGKWLRTSKQRCQDALGVAEISDRDIVSLLTRHELLRTSPNGTIGFGHQLIAGSLAAVLLAKSWRDHLDCLGDPVTDDAWVFAASLVDSQDVPIYLKRILETDLILGARAAREVNGEFHSEVADLLSQAVAPNRLKDVRISGIYALATLGTAPTISSLYQLTIDGSVDISFQARRALAIAGDTKFLRDILAEVDGLRAGHARHSGGNVSVWEAASLPLKLDLARERLTSCAPGSPVNESLLLLAYEMDPADADLIESHLAGSRDTLAWHFAVHALHQVAPLRAAHLFERKLQETAPGLDRVRYVRAAGLAGVILEPELLLQTAVLVESPNSETDEMQLEQSALIRDVILQKDVSENLIQSVEALLPDSLGTTRNRLWEIAIGCSSVSIAMYAAEVIKNWCDNDDAIRACVFFVEQRELVQPHHAELLDSCEQQLERNELDSWEAWSVLKLVAVLGWSKRSITFLENRIDTIVRIRLALEDSLLASLVAEDTALLNLEHGDWTAHAKQTVERITAQLIDAAESSKKYLSTKHRLALLHTSASTHGFGDRQIKMISDLGDAEIDAELLLIRSFWTRLSVLAKVCIRGATTVRISLLRDALREHYQTPSALSELTTAINSCWSEETLEMIVAEIAAIKSWSNSQNSFWDFAEAVASHLTEKDAAVIKTAFSNANTIFGKEVLKWWYDGACGTRTGLASLDE